VYLRENGFLFGCLQFFTKWLAQLSSGPTYSLDYFQKRIAMLAVNRLNPLVAPVLRRVLGRIEPETDVLQPAETESVRPPAFLPGMLDRVTATDEHSVLSYHIDTAQQTVVTHVPVLRRAYRNVLVHRSGFASVRHYERYGGRIDLAELVGPLTQVTELRYCHNAMSWRYFGHWINDAVPSALIEPDTGDLWISPHATWGHAFDYLAILGLPQLSASLVYAGELTAYQDYGQGSHKRARYDQIKRKLRASFGDSGGNDRVYIRRGDTGSSRQIRNEAALIDALSARNWRILDVATASVAEMHQALCRAKVVVSIDGSHLGHAHMALRPGSAMVTLVPHDRFTLNQVGRSRAHQVSPGFLVLSGSQTQGYLVDLDELLRTVELAKTATVTGAAGHA
jgi:Glycosyltransferase 61